MSLRRPSGSSKARRLRAKADFVVDGAQGGLLVIGVGAEVPFVGDEVGCADLAVGFDAVADFVRHFEAPKK
jgi:hypothetical protein